VAALLTLIVFGFFAFVLLPLGYILTLSAVHRCSRCLQRMGEKRHIGLPEDFSQPVWHFRLGKCSVVTARLYAVLAGLCLVAMSAYYVYLRPNYNFHEAPLTTHNIEGSAISTTWTEYLQDCGGDKIIENSVHTKILWNEKYEGNRVTWKGYFADVKFRSRGVFFVETEPNILVKMDPSESTVFADLVLTVPPQFYKDNRALIDNLKKGEGLKFTGTVQGLGSEFKMHHLRAVNLEKSGQFKQLNEILVRESALP
jgi:hypothetical protein